MGQCFRSTDVVLLHQIGYDNCGGSRFTHCATRLRNVVGISKRVAENRSGKRAVCMTFQKEKGRRKQKKSAKDECRTRGKQGTTACLATNELLSPCVVRMAKLPSKAVCSENRRLFMQAFQLNQDSYLLYQYSATTIESFLDELVGGRKMF